jgi:hypothetical protein
MSYKLMQKTQHWQAPAKGSVVVTRGCLWLTRLGDLDDHVLAAGQRLALSRGDDVVIERWHHDMPALWDWQPQARPDRARYRAGALRTLARFLGAGAAVLATLARSAAAMANRAQGCISAGDSTASSGAVQ